MPIVKSSWLQCNHTAHVHNLLTQHIREVCKCTNQWDYFPDFFGGLSTDCILVPSWSTDRFRLLMIRVLQSVREGKLLFPCLAVICMARHNWFKKSLLKVQRLKFLYCTTIHKFTDICAHAQNFGILSMGEGLVSCEATEPGRWRCVFFCCV